MNNGFSRAEMMIWLLARELKSNDVMVVGTGTPVASLAAILARELHAPGLTLLSDAVVNPVSHDVGEPMVRGNALQGQGDGCYTMQEALEYCGRGVATTLLMRPAQVDSRANVNVTQLGPLDNPTRIFPGSLAIADMPVLLERTILYQPHHSREAFVERVDFVTGVGCPTPTWRKENGIRGEGPTCIVTDLCVMRFDAENGWRLDSVNPGVDVRTVVDRTGFAVRLSESTPSTPTPSPEALSLLRETLDPRRVRDLEFRDTRKAVIKELYGLD